MGFGVCLHGSNGEPLMSALGQKQTSKHVLAMSALPPKADIGTQPRDVRFVPKADIASPSWWLQTGRWQSNCAFVGSGGLVHSRPRKLMARVGAAQVLRSRRR